MRLQQLEEHWKQGWQRASHHEGVMHGMRALLALTCVLAYGWRADWDWQLMPVLLGVIASALSESDDNWRGRLRAQCLSMSAFGLIAWAVWATLPWPLLLVSMLALTAFLLTMLGALGERYRAVAFGALVLFIYEALSAQTSRSHAQSVTPYMLGGAAWYGLVSVWWAAAITRPPVRHRLSQLYALLGEYLHLKAQMLEPVRDTDREQRRMALALHNGLVVEALNDAKESLFSRVGKGDPPGWLREALHQYLSAQDIHERTSSSHEQYGLLTEAFFHSDALYRCQRVLALQGDQALRLSVAIGQRIALQHQGATSRAIEDMQSAVHQLDATRPHDRSMRALHALRDNLTALAGVFSRVLTPAAGPFDHSMVDSHPRSIAEAWKRLRAQFTLRAQLCRHALRLSLALVIAFAIMQATQDPHGYWILLTVVFVSQPQYAATLTRLSQRIGGTIMGLALGWALIRLFHGEAWQSVLLAAAGSVFMGTRRTHYTVATCAITTLMLLSFHQMGMAEGVILTRLLDTITGSAIAGLAALLVLPNWQSRHWHQLAAQSLRAQAHYLSEIVQQYQSGKQDNLAYRLSRRNAHRADAALANAYAAMRQEPERVRLHDVACGRFLILSHTQLNYFSALGAHRGEDGAAPVDTALLNMSLALQAQLLDLAQALDAPRMLSTVLLGALNEPGDPPAKEQAEALPRVQRLLRHQLELAWRLQSELRSQARTFSAAVQAR